MLNQVREERDALAAENAMLHNACESDCGYCGTLKARIAALEAENKDLHERLAFAESREVCGAAHDNVETCGFCQRDARDARIYALAAELAGTKDELYSVDKAAKELGERAAQLEAELARSRAANLHDVNAPGSASLRRRCAKFATPNC
jgi:uncharacterized small protein (DUF1192 family)